MLKKRCSRITNLILILLLVTVIVPFSAAFAKSPIEKHVLFLMPFTPDYPAHGQFEEGVKTILQKTPNVSISYSYEYLDYARHSNDAGFIESTASYLRTKYKNHQPDFIVTEFNMFALLKKYGQEIFPDVPVIMSWNEGPLPGSILPKYFFIRQLSEPAKHIELILQTRPQTRKILMVIGDSADERQIVSRIKGLEHHYVGKVEFVYTNKLTYAQMLDAVGNAGDDTAILYFHWFTDVTGSVFIPADVIREIVQKAKVPVYGTAVQLLGSGIIGGYLRDFTISGQAAANVISGLLDGSGASNGMKRVLNAESNIYAFDWRQLQHWGIAEGKLPVGSKIVDKETTVWEKYGGYMIGGIAFMAFQTLLIVALLINRRNRKKAEAELIEANKMKDEFLVNTSHELQTPLNGIINISESLVEGRFGIVNREQQEELKVVLAVARRLSSLIKDIIDMEKMKRNEFHLTCEPVDVRAVSSVVLDVIKHLNPGRNVEMVLRIPQGLCPVFADENRLTQVLFNLLGNAVKFTERGAIVVTASEDEHAVTIQVEDTGIGIPKERQGTLFRAFSQGGAEISREYGGSGLGLYISRQLLARMNGKLRLEWSEPGKGSCFSFTLPKCVEESQVGAGQTVEVGLEEVSLSPKETNQPMVGFKVLAVDDEPTNLRVLQSVLAGDGYDVYTASSGLAAIEILKGRHDFDLVLMDVMMPKMSGYEACRIIREDYSLYDLPLLMLTVRNSPEDLAAGFEAGANDFVVKPFVAKELRARVGTLLRMKQSAQKALRNEMAFLQAQIKPHFLFNTLNTISYFCVRDGEKAKELLNRFSGYLRRSFDFKNADGFTTVRKEMDFIAAYLDIEKARFGSRLQVLIEVDEQVMNRQIPPFVLQPIVENAVQHGIMKKLEGGIVEITVKQSGSDLEFRVRDNGAGMSADQVAGLFSEKKARRVGLRNINTRLEKLYGSGIRLSSEEGQGTDAFFTIPADGGGLL
ncbi:ATP-binding protein [Brevibacillus fluminis]|uniref:ATP-binding protein n=1 Tax=Brevibacillus fluminis TaxID=511487 RepID=UPI003F8CD9C2